jgi:Flp pilus assembly pilin Flp
MSKPERLIKKEIEMFDFRWIGRNKGQGMVEYILIVAVVVGIVFAAYKWMGKEVKDQFVDASKTINTAQEEPTQQPQ